MGQGIRDRFANIATISVLESAAGTLTFQALNTNMGFLGRRDQALAMAIDELQYFSPASEVQKMSASTDAIRLALCVSNQVTDLEDISDRRILHSSMLTRLDFGTAASGWMFAMPLVHQFFPPLITAERTIFLGVKTTGLTGAGTHHLRILFRIETLTGAELVELAEVFRLTS